MQEYLGSPTAALSRSPIREAGQFGKLLSQSDAQSARQQGVVASASSGICVGYSAQPESATAPGLWPGSGQEPGPAQGFRGGESRSEEFRSEEVRSKNFRVTIRLP